jgi:hypothetical protein
MFCVFAAIVCVQGCWTYISFCWYLLFMYVSCVCATLIFPSGPFSQMPNWLWVIHTTSLNSLLTCWKFSIAFVPYMVGSGIAKSIKYHPYDWLSPKFPFLHISQCLCTIVSDDEENCTCLCNMHKLFSAQHKSCANSCQTFAFLQMFWPIWQC